MELIILLMLVIAVGVVAVAAKRGAEAAQRERERRWSGVSVGATTRGDPGVGATARAASLREGRAASTGAVMGAPPASSPAPAPAVSEGGVDPAGPSPAGPGGAARAPAGGRPATAARPRAAPPPVDVNEASVPQLQRLPGVGVRAAERIVAHRERHGRFVSVDDLTAVEGFDQHRISRLAPYAKV